VPAQAAQYERQVKALTAVGFPDRPAEQAFGVLDPLLQGRMVDRQRGRGAALEHHRLDRAGRAGHPGGAV
jgi:hypothetical protein